MLGANFNMNLRPGEPARCTAYRAATERIEMHAQNQALSYRRLVAVAAVCALTNGAALAAPMKIEATLTPKTESKLVFADGSKRYLLATQREGRAAGTGPLAGAMMLEWGVHDVNPAAGANASGYLVFTSANGDIAYLKYEFRAVPLPGLDGKSHFMASGFWETVGGTGGLKGLHGGGTLNFDPKERHWLLEGEMVSTE